MSDSSKSPETEVNEQSSSHSDDYHKALHDVEQAREALRQAEERLDKAQAAQQQVSVPVEPTPAPPVGQEPVVFQPSSDQSNRYYGSVQPYTQQVPQQSYAPQAPQPYVVQQQAVQQSYAQQAPAQSYPQQDNVQVQPQQPTDQAYAQQPQAGQPNQQPYGYQPPTGPQAPINQTPVQPHYAAPYVSSKDHVAAGLLAIFLGFLGVHKFYLGYNTQGFIMLAISVIGGPLLFGLPFGVMWVIAIIEGAVYLTKNQTEFERIYVYNKREWF